MAGELDVASVPDAGSAFVLVLPGPTPVADAAVTTALERALAGEEQRLEERAVLRVLAEPDGHTFVRSRRERRMGRRDRRATMGSRSRPPRDPPSTADPFVVGRSVIHNLPAPTWIRG
jgi:hypothetical protein